MKYFQCGCKQDLTDLELEQIIKEVINSKDYDVSFKDAAVVIYKCIAKDFKSYDWIEWLLFILLISPFLHVFIGLII